MRHIASAGLAMLLAAALLPGTIPGRASAAPAADGAKAAAEQDVVIKTLPGIVVDTKAKEVRLEGAVCLQRGALELIACAKGSKEHESLFALRAKPSQITFALALLGLEPGQPGYVTAGGAFSPPAGTVLDIVARYLVAGGKTVEVPLWKLLRPSGAESALEQPLQWVYVGQPAAEALKGADDEGTIICLSNFPFAVIDVPFESSADNRKLSFEANPAAVPAIGTPVEIVIRPTAQKVAPRKVEIEIVLRKGQPILLDGKPLDLDKFTQAVNKMPVEIQTAVLRVDPEEKAGRVLEVHDVLREALMKIKLVPWLPPLTLSITADDKVRVGEKALALKDFQAEAAALLKGYTHLELAPTKDASPKTVAAVLSTLMELGIQPVVRGPAPEK
jgi:biopolymer transport protein ExbD